MLPWMLFLVGQSQRLHKMLLQYSLMQWCWKNINGKTQYGRRWYNNWKVYISCIVPNFLSLFLACRSRTDRYFVSLRLVSLLLQYINSDPWCGSLFQTRPPEVLLAWNAKIHLQSCGSWSCLQSDKAQLPVLKYPVPLILENVSIWIFEVVFLVQRQVNVTLLLWWMPSQSTLSWFP